MSNLVVLPPSYAPFALSFVYEEQATEMRRLAAQQGYDTLFVNTSAAPEKPGFAMFAANDFASRREVILAVRGTATLQDVVTDIRAVPQRFAVPEQMLDSILTTKAMDVPVPAPLPLPFSPPAGEEEGVGRGAWRAEQWEWDAVPPDASFVCGGIFRAALWLLEEVGPALVESQVSGHGIVLVGHSLGAAVCAVLAALLLDRFPGIRCWAYGCPSCVGDLLAGDYRLRAAVTSVVLHDDVIPRLTPNSIRCGV